MVKELDLEQNPFASNRQVQGSASNNFADFIKTEARKEEVSLSNPFMNANPAILQPNRERQSFQDLDRVTQTFKLSQLPDAQPILAPLGKEWDDRNKLQIFGDALIGSAIDTTGLALQGWADSIAAGTAWDEDKQRNFLEEFASGKDSTMWRAGQAMREAQREWFGEVDITDDIWADDLGMALGSFVPIVGAGLLGSFAGPWGMYSAAALMGAGIQAGDMGERARYHGFNEYDIEFKKAVGSAFALGASEALPVGYVLGRSKLAARVLQTEAPWRVLGEAVSKVPIVGTALRASGKMTPQVLRDMFVGFVGGAIVEGGQEYAQAIGMDYIEQMFLDPEGTIGWTENVYEGVLGGFAGGTIGTILFPFARSRTRRLKKRIEEAKRIGEGVKTYEEIVKEAVEKGIETTATPIRTVLPESDLDRVGEDTIDEGEFDYTEFASPFGVDLTPFDDTGPDWRNDGTEYIDVWDPVGRKKKAKVIEREEKTGAALIEVDGVQTPLNTEYYDFDPKDPDFELSTLDGEGTQLKVKELSDEMVLKLLEDRRRRAKETREAGQKNTGAYHKHLQEGIALKTEAERRGIYKKPTKTETVVEETVEEETEANLDPKDIADAVSRLDESQNFRWEKTEQQQLAENRNKTDDIRQSIVEDNKSNRRSKYNKPITEKDADSRDGPTLKFNQGSPFKIRQGKLTFITPEMAEKILGERRNTTNVRQEKELTIDPETPSFDESPAPIGVSMIGSQRTVTPGDIAFRQLNWFLNNGYKAIPIVLKANYKSETNPEYKSEFLKDVYIDERLLFLQQNSDEVQPIYNADGTQFIHDLTTWSGVKDVVPQKPKPKKSKPKLIEEKPSVPKFGPFGNDLGGKVIGTDTVPSFALEYGQQILEKLNMQHLNVFFITEQDFLKNGKLKPEVRKKFHLEDRLTNASSDKMLNKLGWKEYKEYIKRSYFVSSFRQSQDRNGFVQHDFGPDSKDLHTYVIFTRTINHSKNPTGALFKNIKQAENQRFAKDASVLATIAHEIGHIMEWELFNNSEVETKKAIIKDYLEYKQKGGTFQNLAFNKNNPIYKLHSFVSNKKFVADRYYNEDGSFNNELLIQDIQDVDNYSLQYYSAASDKNVEVALKGEDRQYHGEFAEWFAEQSTRWSLKKVKPRTLSEKFFDRVIELWNKLFEVLGPVKSIEKMYSERASNPLWAQKFPNQKPPRSVIGRYNEWGDFKVSDQMIDTHLEERFRGGIDRFSEKIRPSDETLLADREGPFTNLPLSYRSGNERLTVRFLEESGYREIGETDLETIPLNERHETFVVYNDRVIAYFDEAGTGKVSQKTFKDPNLKQLLTYTGYYGPRPLADAPPPTSTIEKLIEDGATIDEVIADESVVDATEKSVERVKEYIAEEIETKTEEEVIGEVVEPITKPVPPPDGTVPPGDSGDGTGKKAKRPFREVILKWVGAPLQFFGMRNADGSYMYPKIRKIIEDYQLRDQTLSTRISKIFKSFSDTVREVGKEEWADVSAIVVQGDREGKRYRTAQLQEGITVIDSDGNARIVKLSEVGIKGYHKTRDTLDTLGRMINEHNAKMKIKTRKRYNALMKEAVELFNSQELVIKKLPTVEFKPIKDEKGRRVIGYDVTVGYEPSFRVMMSEFKGVDTGTLLKQRIKDSSKVKNIQAKIIAERQRKFKEELESIDFEEEYNKRDAIFYKLSQMRRLPKKHRLDEDALNDLYNQLREIEKKLGYTKRNTPLDALIVSLDIESSRLKPDMDIMTNEGYLPHIWYGSHKVKLVKTLEDGTKLIKSLTHKDGKGGFIGYWKTEAEAQAYAEKFIEDNPKFTGDEIVIENRGTTWADDGFSYRTIPDDVFVKLAEKIPADELENVKTGKQSLYELLNKYGLHSEARRLKPSFEKERLNAEGYSTDTAKVVGSHIQNVLRYLKLDEFKYDAFEALQELEKEGDPLEGDFRKYVDDLIGTERGFEKGFDRAMDVFFEATDKGISKLTQGKVKGINRAGLTAGMTGLLTAGVAGIFSAPTLVTVGLAGGFSYLVYTKVKAFQDAGIVTGEGNAKIFDPFIQSTLSISAHTKLGMLFNLMSPIVNLSQTVINTASIFNYNETFQSMNIVRRYMIAKLTKSDPAFTEKWDALFDDGGVEVDQTLFTDAQDMNIARSRLERTSMYFFQKAETINRMVAYVAGYNRAINSGKTEAQAKREGQLAWNKTQFYYDKSDTSEVLRIKGLKVGTQFKNFLFKQIGFTMGIWSAAFDARTLEKTDGTFETKEEAVARAKEMKKAVVKQLVHVFFLAGAIGMPGLQLLDWLIRLLSGAIDDEEYSPMAELTRWNLEMHSKGEAQGIMADLLLKGAPTLIGQDLSARVGLGNRFIPYNDRLSFGDNMFDQFKGPWISTLNNQKTLAESGATLGDMAVNVSSGIGKPLKAIEMLAGGKDLSSVVWEPNSIGQYAELVMHGIANPSGRVYTSGYKKGQVVTKDVSFLDIINYAIGGRPVSFSRESDLNYLLQWDDKIVDKNVQRIYTKMARAYTQYAKTNPDKFRETLTYLYEEAHEKQIPINKATIKRMFQTLQTPRVYNAIKRVRKSERPEYFKYIEGYTL